MRTKIFAPKNPKTELTREDIVRLTGTTISKVSLVATRDKWGFPKSIRMGPLGKFIYSQSEVKKWMKTNDLKTMVFTEEDRKPLTLKKKVEAALNNEFSKITIGNRPTQFKGMGKSVRVHIPERNDQEKPHPQLSRFSNCDADYRLILEL